MILILNTSEQVTGTLARYGTTNKVTPYFDDKCVVDLSTGAETFTFSTFANTKESTQVVGGNFVAFQEGDGYKLFQISEVTEEHTDEHRKTAYCEMAGIELINEILRATTLSSASLKQALTFALQDTEYQVGNIDASLVGVHTIELKDPIKAYNFIQQYIIGLYGAEISYRVEIKGGRIVGKYIDCYAERGDFKGIRFEYGKSINKVKKVADFTELATALVCQGKNGTTISSVEAPDKPAGQDWIGDEEAYQLYNKNGSHIFDVFKYDTESPAELLLEARKELANRCKPKLKYEVDVELLGKEVSIGDTVYIVDNEFLPPLHLSARVSQIQKSRTDSTKNKVILSNYKEVVSRITDEVRNLASLIDDRFPIGSSDIQEGAVTSEKIPGGAINGTHIQQDTITTDHLQAKSITADKIEAGQIKAEHILANQIKTDHIQANSIDASKIQADAIESTHINANAITTEHLQSNIINANHIQAGSITAGSGIISEGAIGSAQISNLEASKLDAGTIDTSRVTIAGTNGHLKLKGNRLQVFNGTGNNAVERVSVGDVNGDGSVYGLRVRGEDGETVLLDEKGVTREGITDGSITNDKISDNAEIDGAKLNINSVVSCINEDGTEVIRGTKISVNGTNLETKLSTIENTQTTQGSTISQHSSKILANEKAIALKVDSQTYTTDKDKINTQLNKNTSAIDVLKGEIALKVEQTDIENVKTELEGVIDTKVASAKADIKVTTDAISQNVSNLTQTVSTKADGSTVSAINNKVSGLETSVNGINSKVSNLEQTTNTIKGNITSIDTRLQTAESKITDTAITNVVKKSFYTKEETESAITSKGYQTESQVQQTVNGLEVKVSQSGGYNLIYNGDFKRQFECWEPNSAYWKYSESLTCPSGRGIYCDGEVGSSRTVYIKGGANLDKNTESYTLSYWIYTTQAGADGTTNPYRRAELTIYYTDGSASWHSVGNQTKYETWEKHVITVKKPSDKAFSHFNLGLWCRDTTKRVYYGMVMIEKGVMANEWTPNPNEVYDGITTIDKDGVTVKQSNISTYTTMDASSFRVENNTGGTVAEFSQNSQIPNLSAGTIDANNVYASNICSKSPKSGDIKFIYVNGSTGNDTNNGSQNAPYKTVQRAIDDIEDKQDQSVTIYVYNSVPGFDLKGITGTGVITLSLQDSAVINGYVVLGGVTNSVRITNESGSLKATFKNGISIYRCVNVDIYGVTFRGLNAQGNNIYIQDTNYCAVNSCDLGGLDTKLTCAIDVRASLLWLHGCRGSNITDVVGQYAFSHVMLARGGTSNVPDYSNVLLCNYDGSGRIQNWAGGNFNKTPSSGWNPAYTPTQKTTQWSFNKIWSDETLNGWSDRQELIQGYASTWNTGRWTGYIQMTDSMASIRSAISGGTNLSGRIYIQRTSSSGNSTGSKLCLYASDGTLITNSTTINRSQGVWVSLSSSIIQKIQSGAITYFYLKADANNTSTYFKCESNAKIEITYTK